MDSNLTDVIDQTVVIPAARAAVYEALTNPEIHTAFTGAEATGEPKVGQAFTAWDGYITGVYRELQANTKIVADWSTSEWPEGYPPSKLTLTFADKGDKTEVTLRQEAVPASQVTDYDRGWHESYWQPLTAYFATQE